MSQKKDSPILFRCTTCHFKEPNPKEVVDFFDTMDGGNSSVPPRFDCQNCSTGLMLPVHYVNHDGVAYNL